MNARGVDAGALLAAGIDLLQREAALLDERRFDEWLALYTRDCSLYSQEIVFPNTLNQQKAGRLRAAIRYSVNR